MDENQKIQLLKSLDTKKIITDLELALGIYSASIDMESKYRNLNREYVPVGNSDSPAVQDIEFMLMGNAEGKNESQRKAWLAQQKKDNTDYAKAIAQQGEISYQLECYKNNSEVAKKKIEILKVILALKTAQIEFLTEK